MRLSTDLWQCYKYKYKLFISLAPIQSSTAGYQRSLYIQQLKFTSEITTYTHIYCHSVHLNQCHHATQSHYPDTEPTSHCLILIMPSAWLGSDKYKIISHWFDLTRFRSHEGRMPWSPKNQSQTLYSFRRSTHLDIPPGYSVYPGYYDIVYAWIIATSRQYIKTLKCFCFFWFCFVL